MTLRDLQVRLESKLEDGLNQKFGYREFAVTIPNYGTLEPRPKVETVDRTKLTTEAMGILGKDFGNKGVPNELFKVTITRLVPPEAIRVKRNWTLIHDDQPGTEINCQVLDIIQKDSRWVVMLAVIKVQTV